MDNTISFTLNQLIGFVTTVGGCIVVIEAVVLIIFKLVGKANIVLTTIKGIILVYFCNSVVKLTCR